MNYNCNDKNKYPRRSGALPPAPGEGLTMMFLEKIAAAAAEFMDGAVNYVAAEDALRLSLIHI